MLHFAFELLIGKYAAGTAGLLGVLGSIALAIPAFESRDIRIVLLQIDDLQAADSEGALVDARRALTREARRLLARERHWNMAGAALLILAFSLLFLNAVYCAISPAGTCS
jgi:hypothetical protein